MSNDIVKAQYWRKHIAAWKASGESQRRYCQRASVALSSFDRWQRKLRQMGADPTRAAHTSTAPALTLIPAQILTASTPAALRLTSPGGWQLTFPSVIDAAWLSDVIRHLP